jgi:hypothetical protein
LKFLAKKSRSSPRWTRVCSEIHPVERKNCNRLRKKLQRVAYFFFFPLGSGFGEGFFAGLEGLDFGADFRGLVSGFCGLGSGLAGFAFSAGFGSGFAGTAG